MSSGGCFMAKAWQEGSRRYGVKGGTKYLPDVWSPSLRSYLSLHSGNWGCCWGRVSCGGCFFTETPLPGRVRRDHGNFSAGASSASVNPGDQTTDGAA